jgi:signal peptidase I
MQCPSCEFQNIPGLESCGRCGSSLSISIAAIEINPPRASRTAKRLRKVMPHRLIYQARDLASHTRKLVAGATVQDARIPLPEPDILTRLIVPGWAHLRKGLVFRGWFFLAAYLALLLPGLAGWGTGLGSIMLGVAFSIHATSILDILVRQGTVRFPKMMATSALVSLLLAVFIYVPAGLLLTRVAAPFEFAGDAAPFQRLDVVLVNRWAYALWAPPRGDVVQFSPMNTSRLTDGNPGSHWRYAFEENEIIDRLIGLPGDHVVWDAGKLSVNGKQVEWKPLLPERLPGHLDVTVPRDRWLIFPTTSVAAVRAGGSETFWRNAGQVPVADITGRAYLRASPISRFWLIR